MIKGENVKDYYIALVIFLNQVRYEERKNSPIKIDRKAFASIFREFLYIKEAALKEFCFEENNIPFDLYKEVKRLCNIIEEDFKLSIC